MKYSLVPLVAALVSCDTPKPGSQEHVASLSVIDDNGRTIELQRAATRVISLVPAATEIIRVLNAADVLVGRTNEDHAADSAVVEIGTVLDPSVERIVALQPDLVIAWADADLVLARLAKAGISTYAARFERVDATTSNVRRLGVLLGQMSKADSLSEWIVSELETIRKRFQNSRPRSVLYLLEIDPVWTVGPDTFIHDMIEIAGGANIFRDLRSQWSQVSVEAIVSRQPDVIVLANQYARQWQTKSSEPGWRDLDAVQKGRVYFIDSDQFHRPGPGIVDNVRQLASFLHDGGN